jgi:hypothetical protein
MGLDVAEAVAALLTAVLLRRGSPRAALLELPLAAAAIWLAVTLTKGLTRKANPR